MAPRLSENRVGDDYTAIRSSDNNDFTHFNLVVAAAMVLYLASMEERATMCCLVEL